MTETTFPADLNRNVRNAAVVTAVNVARDIYIERHGKRLGTQSHVTLFITKWLRRNGAADGVLHEPAADVVDAVWALAELPDQDPLTLVDDDYRGTSDEARQMLTNQYERDLTHALSRITWKD